MDPVKKKRKKEFAKAVFKPIQINDSRFGLRKLYLNTKDVPSVESYAQPGKNWWGTR